tara:strand:+ start:1205 stop:1468 length:264 start_codon:yes stop_codon:yes gene_type:complete
MKKTIKNTDSKKLVTEFIAKFAKALMGSKAKTLAKTMSKDPGLKDAFERYARESLRFQKHIEKDYGATDPEQLAKNLERTRNKYSEE